MTIDWNSEMATPWVAELFPNVRFIRLLGPRLTTLDELAMLKKLDSLHVDTYSSRRSLDVIPRLRLERLLVRICTADDHAAIAGCSRLDELEVVGWKEPDLTRLAALAGRQLRIARGMVTSLRGLNTERLQDVVVQRCSRLTELGPVSIPSLTVEACNRLDLGSLAAVERLASLTLHSQKRIASFAFVRGCRSLVHLHVGITPLKGLDLRPLIESESLRLLWLSTADRSRLREVGHANRKLTIGSGDWCVVEGKEVKGQKPYNDRLKAFLRSKNIAAA